MIPILRGSLWITVGCLLVLSGGVNAESQSNAPDEAGPAVKNESDKSIDYKELKSPVPYTKRSIARGKMIYRRYCTECHGIDGQALMDVVANATNLTNPKLWLSGTTEGEIFRSISEGAGVDMPPFKVQLQKKEDLWHLVNFVRSLWPEDQRPELLEEKRQSEDNAEGDEESSGQKGEGDEAGNGH